MKTLFIRGLLDLGFGTALLAWIVEGTWRAVRDVRAVVHDGRERRRRRRALAHLEDYRIGPGVPSP